MYIWEGSTRHLDFQVWDVAVCVPEAVQLDTLFGFQPVTPSFHSFGMAYDFIDSVGNDVDVVSDSEVSVVIKCNFGAMRC